MTGLLQDIAEDVVEKLPSPLLILDTQLRVKAANPLFCQTFHTAVEAIENHHLFDIANGAWNIPALQTNLEQANPEEGPFKTFEVEHEFPVIGQKRMRISAAPIHVQDSPTPLILLAFHDITGVREAEDKVQFHRQLLEAAGQAIIAADLHGTIIYWNHAAETLYGWSPSEALGRPIGDLVLAQVETSIEDMARQGQGGGFSGEHPLRRRDGTRFQAFVTVTPIHDEQGHQIGIISVSTDITERWQAEGVLRKNEERFRALVENSADGIFLMDASRTTLYANAAVGRILGLTDEELQEKRRFELVHPHDVDLVRSAWEELLEEPGKIVRSEYRLRYKDGSWRWIERVCHNRLTDPNVAAIVGNFRDITGRRQAEEARRDSEARFRSFFELPLVGMAFTSAEKRILLVNDKLCEMLGYSRDELLQATWSEITHPDDLEADVTQFNRVLAGEIDGYSMDKRFLRKDGSAINVIKTCRCLRDSQGKVTHFVCLSQDITERKRAMEQIKRHNQELGTLMRFSQQSIGRLKVSSLLTLLVHSILDSIPRADIASIWFYDETTRQLIPKSWATRNKPPLDGFRLQGHLALAKLSYTTNQLQHINAIDRELGGNGESMSGSGSPGSALGMPLLINKLRFGVLIIANNSRPHAFAKDDIRWLHLLIAHATLIIQDTQLFEQVKTGQEHMRRLAQEVLNAQEKERGRIARELHDEIGQALTFLKISLQLLTMDLPEACVGLHPPLAEVVKLTDKTIQQLRELAFDLHSPALDTIELNDLLNSCCEDFATRTRLPVAYVGRELPPLHDMTKTYLYRFLQEALTNVAKHAHANHVRVRLTCDTSIISLMIEDDGQGFDTQVKMPLPVQMRHLGLSNMRERLSLLGGWLDLDSYPGQGTRLVAHIPWEEAR